MEYLMKSQDMMWQKLLTIDDTYLLGFIFSYLTPKELCVLCRVSSLWNCVANSIEQWEDHCKGLWKNKQNYPMEPWVLLQEVPQEDDDFVRSQIQYIARLLLQSHVMRRNPFPRDATMSLKEVAEVDRIVQVIKAKNAPQRAAPITFAIRHEQIQLENLLAGMDAALDPEGYVTLKEIIVTNMSSPVRVTAVIKHQFAVDGRLLDWKGSYLASLRDSFRCWPSYEVTA